HDQFYLSEIRDIAGDVNNLDAGRGDDYVSGGEFTDYIDGGLGSDYLLGGTGQDYINGGDGQDTIYGDSSLHYRYVELTPGIATEQLEIAFADGNDTVGQYDDVVIAGGGNDIVWGELGDDDLYGADGDDKLYGDRVNDATHLSSELLAYQSTPPDLDADLHGNDRLHGGAGSDLLVGHGGNDFLSGGADTDNLLGGEGDDTYYFEPGDGLDSIEDDEGTHTLLFSGAALADLQILFQGDQVFVGTDSGQQGFQVSKDEWQDIQIALGSTSALVESSRIDSHYLDGEGNVLISVSGSDVGTEADRESVFTMDNSTAGSPVVVFNSEAKRAELESLPEGGARMNVIGDSLAFVVEIGSQQLQTGLEFLRLTGGVNLQLKGFSGDIAGTSWNDIIEGSAGDDRINAGAGNDIISGLGGADELDGGNGSDQLRGGTGNDALAGGYGNDVYQFTTGDGFDTISDASGSHAFEFDANVDPLAVVMYWTGDMDSEFRLEYSQSDAVSSNGDTSAYWISRITVGDVEIPLVQRSDFSEGHFQDSRYNDVFEGGTGNDTFLAQGWGNDIYRFATGDGQDVIHVDAQLTPSRMGEIRFDASVDLASLSFSFQSGDASISYGDNDLITLDTDTVAFPQDNKLSRFTLVSEADPHWIPTIKAESYVGQLHGTFGADHIIGSIHSETILPGYGDDIIDAGGGGDTIVLDDLAMDQGYEGIGRKVITGGAGNDFISAPLFQGLRFNYDRGDGNDRIEYNRSFYNEGGWQGGEGPSNPFPAQEPDTLAFGGGITLAELGFTRAGTTLHISLFDGSGGIQIEAFFDDESEAGSQLPISTLTFSDGSAFSMATVLASELEESAVTLRGTDSEDYLIGTAGDDVIEALGGNDEIEDYGGNNVIDGGDGNDNIYVAGNNTIYGGAGNDFIEATGGQNLVDPGAGFDDINLIGGSNTIVFGPGSSYDFASFSSDTGSTVLRMADGITRNDITVSLGNSERGELLAVSLADPSDSILLQAYTGSSEQGNREVDASSTIDEVLFSDGTSIDESELLDMAYGAQGEVLIGTDGNDVIVGGAGSDTLTGGYGNDVLKGLAGDDVFIVEGTDQGDDRILGGDGFDSIVGGTGNDTIRLKKQPLSYGIELIDGGAGTNIIMGTEANNALNFSATELRNIDRIEGGAGADVITGSQWADTIVGGTGDDTLKGEGGDDVFIIDGGDQGADKILGGEGFDIIIGGDADDVFTLRKLPSSFSIERIDGGYGSNHIVGTEARNNLDFTSVELLSIDSINGGAGNDLIKGSQYVDTLLGGTGNDVLSGKGGDDVYLFSTGDGQDIVNNDDANPDSVDELHFLDMAFDTLWFTRSGKHLLVDVVGSDDLVKIKNWYANDDDQLDAIHAQDRILLRNQVDQLVSAMAAYDIPEGVDLVIAEQTWSELDTTLAAVWQLAS
ncbi:MAG: calcium-binding protein, partial [Halioglobus sp.]